MNLKEFEAKADEAATLLAAMGNNHRLMLLCKLVQGETRVSDLQEMTGLSQSSASQHLSRLRRDGLVATRRESQAIYYRLASPEVTALIGTLYDLYCSDEKGN
jgi:DNA-binding transcriptional ArsR family regulator